jgi:hypothetical protein
MQYLKYQYNYYISKKQSKIYWFYTVLFVFIGGPLNIFINQTCRICCKCDPISLLFPFVCPNPREAGGDALRWGVWGAKPLQFNW